MAITDENSMVMPVTPMYGGGNNGFGGGFGDGGWWILLLFILFGNGWGNRGGYGEIGGTGMYPWMNQSNQINDGFRDQMLTSQIMGIQNGITSGFGDVQNSLCAGFAGVNASITGAQNALAQQMYTNQIADLERSFNAQTANTAGLNALQAQMAQCCCDNRAGLESVKYAVATENCADRQVVSDGIRDILAATQAQTQAILDRICQDKIDAKNDTIAQLRSELMYARGQASQDVQTAMIQSGQRTLANEIEQYVLPTPKPAYVVANPSCCNQNFGCGCGTSF